MARPLGLSATMMMAQYHCLMGVMITNGYRS